MIALTLSMLSLAISLLGFAVQVRAARRLRSVRPYDPFFGEPASAIAKGARDVY